MPEHWDRFETERLVIHDLSEADLEAILPVYTSNPDYLSLTEGSGGEPGRYDLGMLQRDFAVAGMTPGRHMAGIYLKADEEPIGVLDWMEQNPSDGRPWVGLLIIRTDRQRAGYASEVFETLAAELRARGVDAVRAGVIERNEPGGTLSRRLGFEPISTTTMRMPSEERVVIYERKLG